MKTIEVKTADLIGAALDWAVAKAEGISIRVLSADNPGEKWQVQRQWRSDGPYWPSQDWSQGGPLIVKYIECVRHVDSEWWVAELPKYKSCQYGRTPLIAACRAIVFANLGGTVMVPAELAPNENP